MGDSDRKNSLIMHVHGWHQGKGTSILVKSPEVTHGSGVRKTNKI